MYSLNLNGWVLCPLPPLYSPHHHPSIPSQESSASLMRQQSTPSEHISITTIPWRKCNSHREKEVHYQSYSYMEEQKNRERLNRYSMFVDGCWIWIWICVDKFKMLKPPQRITPQDEWVSNGNIERAAAFHLKIEGFNLVFSNYMRPPFSNEIIVDGGCMCGQCWGFLNWRE